MKRTVLAATWCRSGDVEMKMFVGDRTDTDGVLVELLAKLEPGLGMRLLQLMIEAFDLHLFGANQQVALAWECATETRAGREPRAA